MGILTYSLALVCLLIPAHARIYQTIDAVIVEAEESNGRQERSAKDEAVNTFPFPYPFAFGSPFGAETSDYVPSNTFFMSGRSCWTHDGKLGTCGSVRSCYPNSRLPELSNLETWVIGTRGTCYYAEPNGRQVYGVCCARADASTEAPVTSTTATPTPSPAATPASGVIPTVPVDSNGIPLPGFPWWQYYPWRPLITNATNSTSAKPQADARASCGAGPFKALSIDEQKRIVGGTDAVKNSWPFIVALLNNKRQFCGGSIMDSTRILTAAHCVAHMSSWDVARLEVALGMHNLKPSMDYQVLKKVRRVTRHRGFDSRTLYNDIAILTLDSPIDYTSTISPVCLPPSDSSDQYTDKEAAVIGWGAIREGGGQPSVLQQVTVQIMTNDKCKNMYGSDAPGGIVDHMLCAAYPNKDSCSGDSGGPLLVQQNPGSPWIQAGIVSWGIGCAQTKYPGVYARVTSFMNWIARNT